MEPVHREFTIETYHSICDKLSRIDPDLGRVISSYGYPPFWSRPNTFESLVHIILEQQVSLASALAALNKLKDRLQEITPARVLLLTDEELKACYFSRQKTKYVRGLAKAIIGRQIDLSALPRLENDEIRRQLTMLKGIGNWTVDIYLIFILHRSNIFPVGDLAAVNALRRLKSLPSTTTREELMVLAEQWRPYKTIACMLLWHFYLNKGS